MSKSILIIDNDTSFCRGAEHLLSSLPVVISQAETGSKGQDLTVQLSPDLIILCVELPDTSGYMLCKKLRASQAGKQAHIIITSSKAKTSDFDNHRKKFDYRADSYLKKPIADEVLLQEVSALLGADHDFKGFQKPIEDVQLNDWVNGRPEVDAPHSNPSSSNDDLANASREELEEQVKSQERELEYLRKEVSAFQGFMSQAQKTENALKETRDQLRVREKLLEDMKEHENADPDELLSKITELEHAAEKREKALEAELAERRKTDREVARLKRELEDSRNELDNSESTLNRLKVEMKEARRRNDAQSVEEEVDKDNIRKMQEQVQSLQNRVSEVESLLNQTETDLDAEKSAHEDARDACNLATKKFNEERDKLQVTEKNLREEQGNLERVRDERDRFRLEFEQAQQQLARQKSEIHDRDDQLKAKQDQILKMEARQDTDTQENRRQSAQMEEDLEKLSRELEREKRQRSDLETSVKTKNNELEGLLSRARELEEERNQLLQKLKNTTDVKDDEIKSLTKQLAEVRNNLQDLENTHRDTDAELKSLRRENQDFHGQVSGMTEDLRQHREDAEALRHELDSARKEHNALREKYKETQAQLKADDEHHQNQKSEMNLKIEALNTLLKQTKTDHDIALSILNQEKASLQETWHGEKSQLNESLKKLESKCYEQADTIQSLEKKLESQEQASKQVLDKAAKEHNAEMEQLREEAQLEKARLVEDHTRLQANLNKRIENLEEDKSNLQSDLSRMEEKVNESAKSARLAQEKANERIAELEHDVEKMSRNVQKEREGREEALGKLSSLNTHVDNISRDHEKAVQDLRKQHQQQLEDEKRLSLNARDEISKLELELSHFRQLEERLEKLQKEYDAHRLVSQSWKNRLHLTRQHLETALSELSESEDELKLEED